MLEKLKKLGIIAAIAILFAVLVFSITSAIHPAPDYVDFCHEPQSVPATMSEKQECQLPAAPQDCKGRIDYTYDAKGCPVTAVCNPCEKEFNDAQGQFDMVLFLVSSIAGVIATLFGLYYPKDDEFWTLIKAGFLIGGLASLFIGTGNYYHTMARFLRPIVIFIELTIVIMVTYWVIVKKKK